MSNTVTVWSEAFRVRSYEVGPDGLAFPQTLCNYLQEAASNHAHALEVSVEQLSEKQIFWVLSRLRVEIDGYPHWRDTVTVETWPSGEDGLYATREFLLYDESRQLLARGSSMWLLVDVRRRRPVRIPPFISELRVPNRTFPLAEAGSRPEMPAEHQHERSFVVRYSDIDVNQHVNNVRYIDWAIETVPQDAVTGHRLAALDVSFRAETTYGDTIRAVAGAGADGLHFAHGLTRVHDGREVAHARTRWRPV